MKEDHTIGFGDHVRIRETPETKSVGLAGLTGLVYGVTASSANFEVIGEAKEDYAMNVYFEERGEGFWFTQDLLEFIDHAPGTEFYHKDLNKKWVRNESGEWEEKPSE